MATIVAIASSRAGRRTRAAAGGAARDRTAGSPTSTGKGQRATRDHALRGGDAGAAVTLRDTARSWLDDGPRRELLQRLRPWVAVAVSGITLAVLGRGLLRGSLPDPGAIDWAWTAVFAGAVLITNIVLAALRWALFLPPGYNPAWAVRRYAAATFYGVAVPFGGDVYRSLGGRRLLESVITDRLVSGAVLVTAVLVSSAAAALPVAGPAAVAAVVVALLAIWLTLRPRLLRVPAAHGAGPVLAGGAMTVLYLGATALTLQAGALAAGSMLTLSEALIAAPLMVAGAMLPAVGGLSPNLLVLGWVMGRAGATSAETATTVALFAAAGLLLIAVGGVVIVAGGVQRRWRRTSPEQAAPGIG